jgi:AbrB family looped-hinge helix DNA binding protein
MPVVTTSSRGQIVIPREIRRKLNIHPGKKILVKAEEDRAILLPLPDDPVVFFCGIFQEGASLTKELLSDRRRELKREEKNRAG